MPDDANMRCGDLKAVGAREDVSRYDFTSVPLGNGRYGGDPAKRIAEGGANARGNQLHELLGDRRLRP